jgi:hypothetical protein
MSTPVFFMLVMVVSALALLLMVTKRCAFDRYRVLLDWISCTVVLLMVVAGQRICGVQCLLFITASMLMVLVMASMLSGTKQADWFFTVLVIMATMPIRKMWTVGFFAVAMLMAMASKLVGRMQTTWFFTVAMFMVMAIMLVCGGV